MSSKLTYPQSQALRVLARHAPAWCRKPCRSMTTLEALKKRGLVEMRFMAYWDWEARITEAGTQMLKTMGD